MNYRDSFGLIIGFSNNYPPFELPLGIAERVIISIAPDTAL